MSIIGCTGRNRPRSFSVSSGPRRAGRNKKRALTTRSSAHRPTERNLTNDIASQMHVQTRERDTDRLDFDVFETAILERSHAAITGELVEGGRTQATQLLHDPDIDPQILQRLVIAFHRVPQKGHRFAGIRDHISDHVRRHIGLMQHRQERPYFNRTQKLVHGEPFVKEYRTVAQMSYV